MSSKLKKHRSSQVTKYLKPRSDFYKVGPKWYKRSSPVVSTCTFSSSSEDDFVMPLSKHKKKVSSEDDFVTPSPKVKKVSKSRSTAHVSQSLQRLVSQEKSKSPYRNPIRLSRRLNLLPTVTPRQCLIPFLILCVFRSIFSWLEMI